MGRLDQAAARVHHNFFFAINRLSLSPLPRLDDKDHYGNHALCRVS
jgi:hypothetical protein